MVSRTKTQVSYPNKGNNNHIFPEQKWKTGKNYPQKRSNPRYMI
jgi:hypothetical protein